MKIRRHLITGEPILYAPERSGRPNAFPPGEAPVAALPYDPRCPFCPGNEAETPPESARVGDPWRVRAFPNKYPFAPHHEVIVDAPQHDATFESLPHARDVVAMYLDRYRALARHDGMEQAVLFKNCGREAGASLPHSHAQVAALPFTPPRIEREATAFRQAASCPLCDAIGAAEANIAENESFMAHAPVAGAFSGELWIVPKEHIGDFSPLAGRAIDDLASMLAIATFQVTRLSSSYNWLFLQFGEHSAAHAYVEVIPRTSAVAGFELATGTFIDSGKARA